MVAPATWAAPSSGGTVSDSSRWSAVSNANGQWLAITQQETNGTTYLRYATDPSGTWTQYTFSSLSSPEFRQRVAEKMRHDGTYYYYVTTILKTLAPTYSSRLEYATDPSGTWTTYDLTSGGNTYYRDFRNINGKYVGIGTLTNNEKITSNSSLVAAQSTDFTDAGFTAGYSIDFDGTHYVKLRNPTSGSILQYSTALGSGWTTPSTSFAIGTYGFNERARVRFLNGYWVALFTDMGAGTYPLLAYASDPTGTWTTVSAASTGFNYATVTEIWDIEYGGGYWVLCGGKPGTSSARRLTYLAAGVNSPPDGTFTVASTGLPSGSHVVCSVAYHDGTFVLLSDTGQLLYSTVIPTTTAPTYLRQRQSAVRAPSRVRPVQLRQRQTPIITK